MINYDEVKQVIHDLIERVEKEQLTKDEILAIWGIWGWKKYRRLKDRNEVDDLFRKEYNKFIKKKGRLIRRKGEGWFYADTGKEFTDEE